MTGDAPPNIEVIRTLGEGSMATVFLARNTLLKRLVALKVLREELANDPTSRHRFVREAQAAARITHPSVTTVHTVGELEDGTPYIEMQYVDGVNLADQLQSHGRFDAADAREMLATLADALAAAHESHVIHRDVKPANILVPHDPGPVCLTDFGVAGILESGSETVTKLTQASDRLGDPTYMSPEQLRGEAVTGQTDVYSLGIIGYELLTLHGPFGDAELTDVTSAHLRREPIDLSRIRADVPQDLSDLLKRCLSKKPEHRPRAKELARLFDQATGESEAAMSQGTLVSFLHELKKRHVYRIAVAYAAATFVLLQVADLVFPALDVPSWAYRTCVVVSLAGFPVALALAWVFDLREGRIFRVDAATDSFSRETTPFQRLLLQATGLGVSILLSVAMAWWLL